MRRRALVAGGGYGLLLAVVGCSGSAVTPPLARPAPAAIAARAPSATAPPIHAGDRFAYAGTMTQTFVRTLPSPMPTSKTVTRVAETVVVKGNQVFQGTRNLYDFVTAETDRTTLQTTRSTTDAYEAFSSPNRGRYEYLEYGTNWSDRIGDILSYVYPKPLVLDRLPNAAGRTWSNAAAASIYENESVGADGAVFSAQRFYKANGTYTETATYPPGYFSPYSPAQTGHIQENANGSGYYSAPIYGAGDIVYGPPKRVGGSIGIAYAVYAQASPGPTASPGASGTIPAWYPQHPALYGESDADNGVKPIPSSCGASRAFGTKAEQIVRTITRLDTILGFTETTTQTSYLAGAYGTVCSQLEDVQTSYYDFAGDAPYVFIARPYQVTTTVEDLGLQKHGTNVIGADLRRARAEPAAPDVLLSHGAFDRAVERARNQRERHGGVR